jgi:hypothetical protein
MSKPKGYFDPSPFMADPSTGPEKCPVVDPLKSFIYCHLSRPSLAQAIGICWNSVPLSLLFLFLRALVRDS